MSRSTTPIYKTWAAMKRRCDNEKASDYKFYGGRGITYCSSWVDYDVFLRDMGERPKGMSLDRIDNSLGYSKDNCRWATHKQQCNNRRSTSRKMHKGKLMSVKEISEIENVNYRMLLHRLNVMKISVREALEVPSGAFRK